MRLDSAPFDGSPTHGDIAAGTEDIIAAWTDLSSDLLWTSVSTDGGDSWAAPAVMDDRMGWDGVYLVRSGAVLILAYERESEFGVVDIQYREYNNGEWLERRRINNRLGNACRVVALAGDSDGVVYAAWVESGPEYHTVIASSDPYRERDYDAHLDEWHLPNAVQRGTQITLPYFIGNWGDTYGSPQVWFSWEGPNNLSGEFGLRFDVSVDVEEELFFEHTQTVPPNAPPGEYLVTLHVGSLRGLDAFTYDSDAVTISVTP